MDDVKRLGYPVLIIFLSALILKLMACLLYTSSPATAQSFTTSATHTRWSSTQRATVSRIER